MLAIAAQKHHNDTKPLIGQPHQQRCDHEFTPPAGERVMARSEQRAARGRSRTARSTPSVDRGRRRRRKCNDLDLCVDRTPEDRDREGYRHDEPDPGERGDHPAPYSERSTRSAAIGSSTGRRDEREQQPDPDRDAFRPTRTRGPEAPPHERLGQVMEPEEERSGRGGICFGETTWRRESTPTATMIPRQRGRFGSEAHVSPLASIERVVEVTTRATGEGACRGRRSLRVRVRPAVEFRHDFCLAASRLPAHLRLRRGRAPAPEAATRCSFRLFGNLASTGIAGTSPSVIPSTRSLLVNPRDDFNNISRVDLICVDHTGASSRGIDGEHRRVRDSLPGGTRRDPT